MQKLTREQLFTLEDYAQARPEFRAEVLEHKKDRKLHVGPNATLYFEDRLTIQYQIQEMLRVERIFEPAGIEDELEAYNPLIPEGENLKATLMLEYEDELERHAALARLTGIEARVWFKIHDFEEVWAIADEDLERTTEEKTSAVHFLRFELGPRRAAALQSGAGAGVGIGHPEYRYSVSELPERVRASLAGDIG